LLASAGQDLALSRTAPSAAKVLDDSDVAALFGLEMAEPAASDTPAAPKRPRRPKTLKESKPPKESKTLTGKKTPAAKKGNSPPATPSGPEQVPTPITAGKRHPRRAA
jgi:hypothetical protein